MDNKYVATAFAATAYGLIKTGKGTLVGMYVTATSSGRILFRNLAAATSSVTTSKMSNDFYTPAAGYHSLGDINFSDGLAILGDGTLKVNIFYR